MFCASLACAFGVANYLTGLPLEEADLILFVYDASKGMDSEDKEIIELIQCDHGHIDDGEM